MMLAVASALCVLAGVHHSALAEVTPKPGPGDPRIQSVVYDAQEVVLLRVALGFQLVVELSSDERIESVSLGNAAVWQVTPNKAGDRLFIKPMQGGATTNLTVISSAHRYEFTLTPADGTGEVLPYVVLFQYPQTIGVAPAMAAAGSTWRLRGDKALRPSSLWDDGRFTYLAWPSANPLPAVFAAGPDGEALVNGTMRDGYLVIETVSPQLVFRSGRRHAQATRQVSGERR